MPLDHAWLCRRLVEDSLDAVIFADEEGIIRLWNKGAEEIFGYPAPEALGRSLDLIIPENLRARHKEGYRRVMAAGSSKYARDLLAVPALRRDGSRLSVEFTIIPVKGEQGEILGIGAIIREVTARWQQDKEMRARLAALEAQVRQEK
ncbi:MAG: PAS domain S-box protein [Syntrophales bacterium]|nr:PAS domain S-box protein [Syntrophales bacterium]